MAKVTVIGAGGWGTALAAALGRHGGLPTLWCRRPDLAATLRRDRVNPTYLPDVFLPEAVRVTDDRREAVAGAETVVWAVPSAKLRAVAAGFAAVAEFAPAVRFVSAVKGLEIGSDLRMSQLLREVFPEQSTVVLSGPNHAEEVSRGIPSASVLAGPPELAGELQGLFSSPVFRLYTTSDGLGVELGGALKNVFALAAGMSDGLGFGDNSKAALVTRALAEMVRLGTALNGRRETFYGLSGTGDLMVTAFSRHSRNRRVGERLAQGETLAAITEGTATVAEGVTTARAAWHLAQRHGVDAPITEAVHAVLYEGEPVADALRRLLARGLRSEEE